MSKISLKHTSGKVVSLNSPTTEPTANDVVFNLPNTDGSTGQALVTDGSGNLSFSTAASNADRNVIINSNFAVNQRGNSFFTANSDEYTLDMWYHNNSGATSTITQQTKTVGTELEGQANYLKLAVTTGSDYAGIRYRHEDVKTITPGTWTLSFYAKGTNPTGGLKVWCTQDFGTGGSGDVDIANQTLTPLTGTWTRQSITITVPSFSGKTINDGSFFQITIGQYDAGSTAWELNIANVQFEQGATLTDYEPPRSFADNLFRCQRYFQEKNIVLGSAYNGEGGNVTATTYINFSPTMRVDPGVSFPQTYSSSITNSNIANGISKNGFSFGANITSSGNYFRQSQAHITAEL